MPVILYEKRITGKNDFGEEIRSDFPVKVENVLVAPVSTDDVVESTKLYGKKAVYQLAIPKGDTHKWEDAVVEFFGKKWKTFGFAIQGIEENIPLEWNQKIQVEAHDS